MYVYVCVHVIRVFLFVLIVFILVFCFVVCVFFFAHDCSYSFVCFVSVFPFWILVLGASANWYYFSFLVPFSFLCMFLAPQGLDQECILHKPPAAQVLFFFFFPLTFTGVVYTPRCATNSYSSMGSGELPHGAR